MSRIVLQTRIPIQRDNTYVADINILSDNSKVTLYMQGTS